MRASERFLQGAPASAEVMTSTRNFYRQEIPYSELPDYNAANPTVRRPRRLLPRVE